MPILLAPDTDRPDPFMESEISQLAQLCQSYYGQSWYTSYPAEHIAESARAAVLAHPRMTRRHAVMLVTVCALAALVIRDRTRYQSDAAHTASQPSVETLDRLIETLTHPVTEAELLAMDT